MDLPSEKKASTLSYWRRVSKRAWLDTDLRRPSVLVTTLTLSVGVSALEEYHRLDAIPGIGTLLLLTLIVYFATMVVVFIGNLLSAASALDSDLRTELDAEKIARLAAIPAFELEVQGIIMKEGQEGAWVLTVEAVATNLGGPSPLRGWRFDVLPVGRVPIHAHLLQLRDDNISHKDGSKYKSLTREDSLDERSGLTQVPRNGSIRGHLRFLVQGVTPVELQKITTTEFRLSAIDVAGNTVATTITLGELRSRGEIPIQ